MRTTSKGEQRNQTVCLTEDERAREGERHRVRKKGEKCVCMCVRERMRTSNWEEQR